MKTLALSFAVLGTLVLAAPAYAQATRTWVSGVGDDANPCSRTAPCKTFAGAISKTAAAGEINCLDSGGFGGLTITKSLTVSCEGVIGGALVSGTAGFTVNAAATDIIVIRGLDFEGLGTGTNGIRVLSAAHVVIENCIIRNFRGAAPNGFGIQFATTATSSFSVRRTTLINNGDAVNATGGAIQVRPVGGTISGAIDHVLTSRNVNGLVGDGFGGGSGLNVSMTESVVNASSANGVLLTSAVGASIMIQRSAITNNSANGLLTQNAGATIRVGNSVISGNSTATSGNVQSYGTNQINGNGADTIPAAVPGGMH
jgi:hypothetical protein